MTIKIGTMAQVQVGWLAVVTAALVPFVFVFIISVYWLHDHAPDWIYWKAGLLFLIALEVTYWLAAMLVVPGVVVLGFLLFRHRRAGRHPLLSRGFLLCVSITFGLIVAETVSAIWQYRSGHRSVVSIGGQGERSFSSRDLSLIPNPQDIKLPTTFQEANENGEINLVVVGESSAAGVPYDFWISIGQILGWQLEEAIAGRTVRIETFAHSGDTLYRQHEKLVTMRRRPDVLIVYCGHNEFSARFSASSDRRHYFDEQLPTIWTALSDRMAEVSPVTSLIRETAEKCRIAIPPPRDGNRALVDVPVYTLTDYNRLLTDFRRRLEAIVAYAEHIGAIPILIVPPSNDAGFEPNRSFLPAGTTHDERKAFRKDFLAARRIEDSDPTRAIVLYRALLARQPRFAETHYRIARLLERDSAWDQAYDHYRLARDCDGFPMRMPSDFQRAYHELATSHACILIDGQSYFHMIGRHGLLDDALFHDGVHPSLRGQIALAQAILQALQKRRAFGWPRDLPAPVIDPASCAKHFALTPEAWRRICLWGIMYYDRTTGARYDSTHRLQMKVAFANAATRIEAGEPPESVGLPNVGLPEPVPMVPIPDSERAPRQLSSKGN